MIRLFVRHSVSDFATWRQHYDDFDAGRRALGVRDAAVFTNLEDGNEVTVTHDFDSAEAAQAFVGSAELKEVMEAAGVVGAPTIWFTSAA